MASESTALWDDSGWLSWPVGGSARPVCPGSVNRDTAVFQSVEKDEATQAIICTILSASNTSLWRFLLKGFYRGAGGQGETWRSFRKLEKSGMEKMGRDSSVWCSMLFFSLEDCGTPAGVPFLQWQCVCLYAWGLWVPATGCLCWLYGADGACIVELRVNDTEGVTLCEGGFSGGGGGGGSLWSHWEWMQGFCLCCFSLCWLWRGVRGCLMEMIC